MLFNLFLNDLPESFNSSCDPIRIGKTEVSCLLYVDDLSILSETETGHRASINELHSYAKKWQLSVNIKKTKIMVFNKMGRHYSLSILLGSQIINSCLEYDYLGTTFTPTGSFKLAKKSLYKKAYYSFLNDINIESGAQISTMKKLFHTLVKPILLCNCDVWGSFLNPRSQASDYFISDMFDDRYYNEVFFYKSCKDLLGVHSRSSNDAVRGELGMHPLNVYIYKQIVKFYFHLIDISKQSPVIREECENLVNNGKPSWIATVFNLLSLADIKDVNLRSSEEISRSNTLKQIEITITLIHEGRFFERIHNSKRLSYLYTKLKQKTIIKKIIYLQ